MWSFLSTAAFYNQGDFLLSAAKDRKNGGSDNQSRRGNLFGHEKWLPSSGFFSFLPLGRSISIMMKVRSVLWVWMKRACLPCDFTGKQALRSTSGSFAYGIFSCEISTRTSVLHLGQYSGKLNITVSSYTFVRVLMPQIGHFIHCVLSILLFMYDSFVVDCFYSLCIWDESPKELLLLFNYLSQ